MGYPIAPPDAATAAVGTGQAQASKSAPRTQQGGSTGATNAPEPVDPTNVASSFEKSSAETVLGSRTIEFAFDDTANRIVVKVKSADSGEVVRQIPPEDYLKFLARFREMIGVLFDEKA